MRPFVKLLEILSLGVATVALETGQGAAESGKKLSGSQIRGKRLRQNSVIRVK